MSRAPRVRTRLFLPPLLAACAVFLFNTSVFALHPEARVILGGRVNLRSFKEGIPSEVYKRAELIFSDAKKVWTLFPFFEARWGVDNSEWSRIEVGAEAGFAPFEWVYLGSAIHQAEVDDGDDHPEWELRSVFYVPLPLQVRSRKVRLYALNEFTYDLDEGRSHRNEIGVGVEVPLPWKRWKALLGWRHIDLVHGSDMDQIESMLVFEF